MTTRPHHANWTFGIRPRPDHTLTRAEWEAYMALTVTYRGRAAVDLRIEKDAELPVIVWPDGTRETVERDERLEVCWGLDPRFEYDQNRSIVGVRPEYRGEAETWDINT